MKNSLRFLTALVALSFAGLAQADDKPAKKEGEKKECCGCADCKECKAGNCCCAAEKPADKKDKKSAEKPKDADKK